MEHPWPYREGLTLWRPGFVVERWDPPLPVDGPGDRLGALVVARGLARQVDRAARRNSSSEFTNPTDRSVRVVLGLCATSVGKILLLVFTVLFSSRIAGPNEV